jgi:hypothetical protein
MQLRRCAFRRRCQVIALAIGSTPFLIDTSARADRYWINGNTTGAWTNSTYWSTYLPTGAGNNAPPGASDTAFLTNSTASLYSITLNESDTILGLNIGNTAGGSDVLSQTGSFNLSMGTEQIGYANSSIGGHNQSAGTNTYSSALILGSGTSSIGTYSLSGSGSIDITGLGSGSLLGLCVGNYGAGTFIQSAGAVTIGNFEDLILGNNSGGAGTYLLSGTGLLTTTGVEAVGLSSAGTFNQSGGDNVAEEGLNIAADGSPGTYLLSGGSLNVTFGEFVGYTGAATFNQSGGIANIAGGLIIGESTGTYFLSNGTLSITGNEEQVGIGGSGTFNQSGGVQTIGQTSSRQNLYIGYSGSASAGTFLLSGGSLTINGDVYVGAAGGTVAFGTLAISGGAMAVTAGTGSGTIFLSNGGTLSQTSTGTFTASNIDQSGGVVTLNSLDVDGVATNSVNNVGSYTLSGGTLTVNGSESVAGISTGTFNQTGGVHIVANAGNLAVGNSSSGGGTYLLSGTGSLTVTGTEYVGSIGAGTFNQSGGSNAAETGLAVGLGVSPNAGTYLLSGGTLSVTGGVEAIGEGIATSVGTFKQTGGIHTIGSNLTQEGLAIGQNAAGVGTYLLSAGTLDVYGTVNIGTLGGLGTLAISGGAMALAGTGAGTLYIDAGGTVNQTSTGTFTATSVNQSGGTGTLTGLDVDSVAATSGYVGSYILGGGTLTVTGNEIVGDSGVGTFDHNNGSHSVGGSLQIGVGTASVGTFFLAGGTLAIAGQEYVGYSGAGTFGQNGGSQSIGTTGSPQNLTLGVNSTGAGTCILSGGTLAIYGSETVGSSGAGSFNQNSGTQTIGTTATPQNLYVGYTTGGTGGYTLSSGTLSVTGTEYIGDSGTGTFIQSGGIQTIGTTTTPQALYIAYAAAVSASDSMTNIASLTINGYEVVGENGAGTFTQTNGRIAVGTTVLPQQLDLGYASTGAGTYLLSGTGSLTVNGGLYIGGSSAGAGGAGTFAISGGSVSVTGPVDIFAHATLNQSSGTFEFGSVNQSGGTASFADGVDALCIDNTPGPYTVGSYTLSNGALAVPAGELVGLTSGGTFSQSGGFNSTSLLYVGDSAAGTYNLSGTGSLSSTGTISGEIVGNHGAGTFNQTGGTNNSASGIVLGNSAPGTYLLSNGTLSSGGYLFIGTGAAGTFNQSGGASTIGTPASQQAIDLGYENLGACLLSSGSLTVNGSVYLGGNAAGPLTGTGNLEISGGAMTVTGTLQVYNIPSSVTLSGGQLSVGSLITGSNPAAFNWTGGTLSFLNGVTIGSSFFYGSTVNLAPGFTLGSGSSFTNNGSITLTGGGIAAAGALTNNSLISGTGTITVGSGSNQYQMTQSGGNLWIDSVNSPFTNYYTLNLANGYQLILSGVGLSNQGSMQLTSAVVTGSGTLANGAGGTIIGPGLVLAPFTNLGTVVVPSGQTNLPACTNNGNIQLDSTTANLGGGGTITNDNTIQNFGIVSDPITNNATIEALGGTLVLTGAVTNTATGLITAGPASKVLMQAGNFQSNAGEISLYGGVFDNGGGSLSNTGTISGYGTFRAGSWSNASAMSFTGGSAGIYGAVTNTGSINVTGNSTTTFYNNVNTSAGPVGSITVNSGSTVVFLGTVTGQSRITGSGTVDFESGSVGGALANPTGNLIVGSSAIVAASDVQEDNAQVSGSLTINSTAPSVSIFSALTIAGGTLDLKSNALIVNNPAQRSSIIAAVANAADFNPALA